MQNRIPGPYGSRASAIFPGNTKMLFVQSAAPPGWVKDTDQNDKALRIVSGNVGVGGNTAFSSVFGAGKTAAAHALAASEIPAIDIRVADTAGGYTFGTTGVAGSTNPSAITVSGAGGGAGSGHTHGLSLDLHYVDVIKCTKS